MGRLVGLCLRATLGRRAEGGGALPPSGTAGRFLPVDVTKAPALSVEGPRSVPTRISMVLVDGTMAGDTPGWQCPREDGFWRLRAGETRPAGVSVGGGDDGLPRVGEMLSSPDVTGRSLPVVPAGGVLLSGYCEPCGLRWPSCCRIAPVAHARHCLYFFMTLWDVRAFASGRDDTGSRSVRAFGSGPCWPRWPACC